MIIICYGMLVHDLGYIIIPSGPLVLSMLLASIAA